ncbi:type II toxin-antitoxin system prevent-host-death family antitoxin [Cupriavidus basilensis]|uniref:type II toxin-antitoxin system prevent-host-death family antitoxin n=1 Tax=Cupriavidus basilensis TaxID=68895 RepID=UPI0007508E3D|nr:type II toxin-antitoxin system prevent-host-death family antitoxin [Cupriavidus basilensis]
MTENQWVINVTKFSANPSRALQAAQEQPVLVVKHQRPHAYLVSASWWREVMTLLAENRAHEAERPAPSPCGNENGNA